MKYPFSPELLDAMPEALAELYRELELTLLTEISQQLISANKLNASSVQRIRALRAHGIPLKEIQAQIAKTSKLAKREVDALFADVVERNRRYFGELAGIAEVTAPTALVDAGTIAALVSQTQKEISNITRSMGFIVDAGRTKLPAAKVYQWALDSAALQVQSGAVSYTDAIANATKQLADSGLKTVDYESGRADQVDVAVRRAVMTSIVQVNSQYVQQGMEFIGADYVEVSAHSGARDKGDGFENHKDWQGKVYYWRQKAKGPNAESVPDFESVCGYGDVQGILGANCRHSYSPFLPGIMERTYTDEQLANIDPPPFEYQGKTYTHYEATQKQRELERTVRKWKRREAAATNPRDKQIAEIRIRRLQKEYKDFSAKAKLRRQPERMKVYTKLSKPV